MSPWSLRPRTSASQPGWAYAHAIIHRNDRGNFVLQGKIPQLSVNKADIQTISIGELGLGPISIGSLMLNNIDFTLNAAQALFHNLTVTVTLHLSLDWHIHIGLPD